MTAEEQRAIRTALDEAVRFFTNRDEMNAAVHCSEVRWSPVTELVVSAQRLVYAAGADL